MSIGLLVVGLSDVGRLLVSVLVVWVRPGGRIATTFSTPLTYLNVYSASSSASRRSSSSRAVDGVPTPIAQFLPPTPHRL